MKHHDISQPLTASTPVWPGDQPFAPVWNTRIERGSSVNVGAVTMSLHTGTHADAPLHVRNHGAAIHELPISAYIGPALVVELPGEGGIGRDELAAVLREGPVERLLVKTRQAAAPRSWTNSFRYFESNVVELLAQYGTRLIGIDTPSVDHPDSKTLSAHHLLYDAGIVNLENLELHAIKPGEYILMSCPVIIEGMDAGPVRAVLLEDPELVRYWKNQTLM